MLATVILLQILATWLNPKNPARDVFSFAMGFLPLLVLPPLFLLNRRLDGREQRFLETLATVVLGIWAIVAITQNIWGWKISGISIVTGEHFTRSQGFYSHPLTLAYVSLMLWPLVLNRLLAIPRDWKRILSAVSVLTLLYFSASRTAQAVALLVLVGSVLWTFRGRVRWLILGGLIAAIVLILATPNRISERFSRIGTEQLSEEKESAFADDRIAFWIVHSNMVKERPILGHGINLDRKYRVPYYEAIGLHDFQKAYEAHNQLLQLAAEGGIFCALAFLGWLVALHFHWKTLPTAYQRTRDLTLLALFLGGLTQNAYFDGEVRFALILLMALAYGSLAGIGKNLGELEAKV